MSNIKIFVADDVNEEKLAAVDRSRISMSSKKQNFRPKN